MSTFTLPQRTSTSPFMAGATLMGLYKGYMDKDKETKPFKEVATDSLWTLPGWFLSNVLLMAKSGIKMTPSMLGRNVAASTLLAPMVMAPHITGYYAAQKFSDLFGKNTYDRKQQHNSGTAQKIY